MYGEQFATRTPCVWHSFSKRIPSMSTTSTSSRSKVIGCATCAISARRSTKCEHRSSPDKQIRVPSFSQIRLIFNVIASRQILMQNARRRHFTKQYLAASHIIVATYGGVQTIPDKQLAAVGARRRSSIRVPYFGVALQCLPGTELVLTLTSGMTSAVRRNRDVRLVKAPRELRPFWFLMAWHPRVDSDPPHMWLREALRQVSPQAASG